MRPPAAGPGRQGFQGTLLGGAADRDHRRTAARCVHCPVSTATNISYFWLSESRRRCLRAFTAKLDVMVSLQNGQIHRSVAGYFRYQMVS